MKKCYTHYYNIGKFISNIGDNWRNCIYVTCSVCKHDKQECCDDLLVSFDETGIPTIIMLQALPENDNISIAGSWKKGTRFRQERRKSLRCGNVSGKSTRTWRMASNPMEIR